VTGTRRRHGFHFSVPAGWINDPHGVCWHEHPDGARYELFFQYNPDAPEWVVACRWGRCSSPDLVRWGAVDVALAPAEGEAGCWTGSAVVDDDGSPALLYTTVREPDLDLGAVVLAVGDERWESWRADPSSPVLPGPPEGLGVVVFRDPHVEREGTGWRMVIGAGTADRRGLALLYRSPDLRAWRYEGVLAERPAAPGDPLDTGAAWECVQFFPLDGRWVLLVSAWDAGVTMRVIAAVGDFDGQRFTARRWQRFGATDVPYATTTFLDAAGRRCAFSWAREARPTAGDWSGALTVPWVLGVRDGRLVVAPHPDVATLRTGIAAVLRGAGATPPLPPHLDVEVAAPGGGRLELQGASGPLLTVDVTDGAVELEIAGQERVRLGTVAGEPVVARLLLDGGLVEVATPAGECAVVRLPSDEPVRLVVPSDGGDVRVTAHAMPVGSDLHG
jgi:beta-fructofuranosidase